MFRASFRPPLMVFLFDRKQWGVWYRRVPPHHHSHPTYKLHYTTLHYITLHYTTHIALKKIKHQKLCFLLHCCFFRINCLLWLGSEKTVWDFKHFNVLMHFGGLCISRNHLNEHFAALTPLHCTALHCTGVGNKWL